MLETRSGLDFLDSDAPDGFGLNSLDTALLESSGSMVMAQEKLDAYNRQYSDPHAGQAGKAETVVVSDLEGREYMIEGRKYGIKIISGGNSGDSARKLDFFEIPSA